MNINEDERMKKESTENKRYEFLSFEVLSVNLVFVISIGFPIATHLINVVTDISMAFFVDVLVVLAMSAGGGLTWAKAISRTQLLSLDVSPIKSIALKHSRRICFEKLWFVPIDVFVPISDSEWVLRRRHHGQSIKAGLLASPEISYFALGALSFLALFAGLSGDFGIALDRIAAATGAIKMIQFALVALSSFVSSVYLFSGFFQVFLSRG